MKEELFSSPPTHPALRTVMSQVHVANNVMEAARLHSQGHLYYDIPFSSGLGRIGITLCISNTQPNRTVRLTKKKRGDGKG